MRWAQGELFPEGRLDQDLQQVDLRGRNSWRLLLAEVSTVELLETQLVNAVAPFVLNARLKSLLLRTPERDKHIVNVSAVEGQFYRRYKTTRHPHTNMAKAALNMMTRTSAADYHADGIHMNSVDTGWVTDEDPVADRRAQGGGAPLLAAARHRRRRRPHRRPDHRRLQHRHPRLGPVPEGLQADRLVDATRLVAVAPGTAHRESAPVSHVQNRQAALGPPASSPHCRVYSSEERCGIDRWSCSTVCLRPVNRARVGALGSCVPARSKASTPGGSLTFQSEVMR